jgi:hypothetical protein
VPKKKLLEKRRKGPERKGKVSKRQKLLEKAAKKATEKIDNREKEESEQKTMSQKSCYKKGEN